MNPHANYRTLAFCDGFDDNGIRSALDLWFSDRGSAEIEYGVIGRWGTCDVTSFDKLFYEKTYSNEDISRWDTGKSLSMRRMFLDASSFNGDISDWDVAATTSMELMFSGAKKFNGDLSDWDVASVTSMSAMFYRASSFNRCIAWEVEGKDTGNMFTYSDGRIEPDRYKHSFCLTDSPTLTLSPTVISPTALCGDFDDDGIRAALNLWFSDRGSAEAIYGEIGSWGTCDVTNFSEVFVKKTEFNEDISQWDTGRSTSMDNMFKQASSFNGDISRWDVAATETMYAMFIGANSFNGDLSQWDVGSSFNMALMFDGAISFNGDLSEWDVTAVQDIYWMFYGASAFNRCLEWDLTGKDRGSMFFGSNGRIEDICPTSSPTNIQTNIPTKNPTGFPADTVNPTNIPTGFPTLLLTTPPTSIRAPASTVNVVATGAVAVIVALLLIGFLFKHPKNGVMDSAAKDDREVGPLRSETPEDTALNKHAAAFLAPIPEDSENSALSFRSMFDFFRVEPSAPPAASVFANEDPLATALRSVDRLSSLYLGPPGPPETSAPALRDALAAAVALCGGAGGGEPPANPPPESGGGSLGDALRFLAGVSKMYQELGGGTVSVSVVRTALVGALVRCEEAAAGAGAAPL